MFEASLTQQLFESTEGPVRRGSPGQYIRLDFKGNFHRAVDVTNDMPARENARRGK
jgi:hypothetical protein